MDVRLKKDFSLTISGASGCGKSYLVYDIIKSAIRAMRVPPSGIIICYGCPQSFYQEFIKLGYPVQMIKGVLDFTPPKNSLIIFDDLQEMAHLIEPYFTKYVHHLEISVIYLTQNLYLKTNRTITLNSQYIILFKSPRDKRQIQTLAQQMEPRNSNWVVRSYNDATIKPHSYVLFDFLQTTNEEARVRDGIIPELCTVYVDQTKYVEDDINKYVSLNCV